MIAATDEHRTTERLLVGVTVPDGGARWGRSGRQQQPPPALSVAAALQQSSQAPPRQQLPPRQQQPPCHNTQRTQTATRRVAATYSRDATHTAAPTHQHHPSGSSGGTSGAAVGRPTGAQHSRHSYSVAADSSQQGPATTRQRRRAAERRTSPVRCGGTFRRIHRDLLPYPYDCVRPYCTYVQHSTGVCTRE